MQKAPSAVIHALASNEQGRLQGVRQDRIHSLPAWVVKGTRHILTIRQPYQPWKEEPVTRTRGLCI